MTVDANAYSSMSPEDKMEMRLQQLNAATASFDVSVVESEVNEPFVSESSHDIDEFISREMQPQVSVKRKRRGGS